MFPAASAGRVVIKLKATGAFQGEILKLKQNKKPKKCISLPQQISQSLDSIAYGHDTHRSFLHEYLVPKIGRKDLPFDLVRHVDGCRHIRRSQGNVGDLCPEWSGTRLPHNGVDDS